MSSVNSVTNPPVPDPLKAKLRQAAARVQGAAVARDELICQAMDAGASSREVAELVGLSHSGVIKIWKRMTGEPR